MHILNGSSESVVSCLWNTTVHWSVQYSCDQSGYRHTHNLQFVCTCVYFTQMHRLRTDVKINDKRGCRDWIESLTESGGEFELCEEMATEQEAKVGGDEQRESDEVYDGEIPGKFCKDLSG